MFVESGGDNLTAIFSPALADVQIFVIDVAAGDDIPRKGGPGIARADLLAINKTDLAPYVGSDVARMVARGLRAPRRPAGARDLPAHDRRRRRSPRWVRDRLAAFRAHGHLHSSIEGVPDHATLRGRSLMLAVERGRFVELRRGTRVAPRVLAPDRATFVRDAGRAAGGRSRRGCSCGSARARS